jgi:hypothetical protein
MLSLPDTLKIADLKKCHADYSAKQLDRHNALYLGGSVFRERVNDFLVKRPIENVAEGAGLYDGRKRRSPYTNRIAGLIDFFVSAVFPEDPIISCEGGDTEYWESLNTNFDGLGSTIGTVARQMLLRTLIDKRAYLLPTFEQDEAKPTEDGSDDARFAVIGANVIEDWEFSQSGSLLWARMHTSCKERDPANPYLPAETEVHYYTYFDEDSIITYKYIKDKAKKGSRRDDEAVQIKTVNHQFGMIPLFDCRARDNQWVLERTEETLVELYNRESDLTNLLNVMAMTVLVLSGVAGDLKDIYLPDLSALKLQQGDAKFICPEPGLSKPLFDDIDRLKDSLSETVQTLALQAINMNVARPVAAKTEMDNQPLNCLLRSFAWPIREQFQRGAEGVRDFRGEDGEVHIEWPNPRDITARDMQAAIEKEPIKDGKETGADPEPSKADSGDKEVA